MFYRGLFFSPVLNEFIHQGAKKMGIEVIKGCDSPLREPYDNTN